MIRENLASIHERIEAACRRAGRDPSTVRLISVTKTKPVSMLEEAYEAGERLFGENKVQEIQAKQPLMPADISWHMIGHLQTNKVKYLMGSAAMIHSVDSEKLACTISREAEKAGLVMPVLLEVNMAEEESKFGLSQEQVLPLIYQIKDLPGISIRGLMTIAPFTENAETNRVYFRKLRELAVDINEKSIDNVNMYELSMGMTGDFEVAIEEGATFVRIGTAIFGERYVI